MIYHERALNYYFIPCHRKYSGQRNQYAQRMMGRLDAIFNGFPVPILCLAEFSMTCYKYIYKRA